MRLFETGTNAGASGPTGRSLRVRIAVPAFDGEHGTLRREPAPRTRRRTYRYDPLDPAPTQIDVRKYPIEDVPLDQTEVEARPDVITYTSEPLTEELVISGWPHLELYAASDWDDTDWHVKLTDVPARRPLASR